MRGVVGIRVFGGAIILAAAVLASSMAHAADPEILASSCSICHTNSDQLNTAIPKIRGLPEASIVEMMRAFRTGQRPATVMGRIAKGFTEVEIKQLAAYFNAKK